ncbi:MAG: MmgE/PrpD family protein, partial [Deltaproteobacteria bacterium]|nr:MmgE/PrpD family protein [Deltaproteobacteria bacterium]
MGEKTKGMTMRLAEFISETKASDIPKDIYEHAKVAFLDWLGVTMGGLDDPLVEKLIDYTVLMGGNEQASLLGRTIKKSLAQAALINGAASHALDYDDSLIPFLGHPSVTLFPGLLALSEWQGKSGADFLTAYIIGLKSGVAIASCAGGEHYLSGYHGTSTMGTLAAASACSRLLGLDKKKTVYALGIAGTQSAGLKRVFGTMCKPFHAGRAAEVGLMAALLAQSGFDSAEDILEGPSGLFAAMKGQVREEVLETLGQTWEIENLAQKYHASCHGTHSAIEASLAIFKKEKLTPDQVKAIRVNQSAVGLSAAFRTEAKTGLEAKFSIPYCVANAVIKNTTGLQAFSQERVNDPEVQAFMPKIKTQEDPDMLALEARVE